MKEKFTANQCPYRDMAKRLAEQRGYDLTYKMLNEDFDRETLMKLLQEHSQTADGEKIGGYTNPSISRQQGLI